MHHAALWRAQPLFGQIDAATRYPWRDRERDESPALAADGPVIVSACKPAADGRGLILRLFNATAVSRTVTLRQRLGGSAEAVRLDETPDGSWAPEIAGATLRLALPPFGLRTLRLV